jgi:hypothetical protein
MFNFPFLLAAGILSIIPLTIFLWLFNLSTLTQIKASLCTRYSRISKHVIDMSDDHNRDDNFNSDRVVAIATSKIASLTKWQAISAISSTFLAMASVCVMWLQLVEARTSSRTWVGATAATLDPPQVHSPAKASIVYVNSGKEPAAIVQNAEFTVYSREEWNNLKAANDLIAYKEMCMKVPSVYPTTVAFPTTAGSSYNITIISNADDMIRKYIVSDDVIKGESILVVRGCMAYKTGNLVGHSPFCFFYDVKAPRSPTLNICLAGWDAD